MENRRFCFPWKVTLEKKSSSFGIPKVEEDFYFPKRVFHGR